MLEEHSWSTADASDGASEAGHVANGTDAAASDVSHTGSADDGLCGVPYHVLVVGHGAYIREAVGHLVEDLECSLSPGVKPSRLFSPCPNTGIGRFIFTLSRSEQGPVLSAVRCVFVNRKDHLEKLKAAEH